nr:MAG TPA: hypothetical protein [Bacteriophage sp.]
MLIQLKHKYSVRVCYLWVMLQNLQFLIKN